MYRCTYELNWNHISRFCVFYYGQNWRSSNNIFRDWKFITISINFDYIKITHTIRIMNKAQNKKKHFVKFIASFKMPAIIPTEHPPKVHINLLFSKICNLLFICLLLLLLLFIFLLHFICEIHEKNYLIKL